MTTEPKARGRGFDLGDYVEVKDRIKLFYERHPDGRLVTTSVTVSDQPDGKPRVTVEAAAYRTPDDPLPARGNSWMELPGTTSYTRGSELENTETSAWGRAIGALGIGIDRSIASAQEVRNKEGGPPPQRAMAVLDGGMIGLAEAGKGQADFELRQTPTGHALAFRLVEGRKGIKVVALDALAEWLAEHRAEIEGQRVTCHGSVTDESFKPKDADRPVTYQVLRLERIETPAGAFPEAAGATESPDDPLGDLPGWTA